MYDQKPPQRRKAIHVAADLVRRGTTLNDPLDLEAGRLIKDLADQVAAAGKLAASIENSLDVAIQRITTFVGVVNVMRDRQREYQRARIAGADTFQLLVAVDAHERQVDRMIDELMIEKNGQRRLPT